MLPIQGLLTELYMKNELEDKTPFGLFGLLMQIIYRRKNFEILLKYSKAQEATNQKIQSEVADLIL